MFKKTRRELDIYWMRLLIYVGTTTYTYETQLKLIIRSKCGHVCCVRSTQYSYKVEIVAAAAALHTTLLL